MSRPTTRILTMLELLQARRQLTVGTLADRLGVDERTVRRYADRLAELGIPVEAQRGRYGGYRLLPGFKLPPLMFSDDEATAVVLGLLAGRRLGLPGDATDGALAKVQRVLPTALAERVRALQETLGFTLAPRPGTTPAVSAVLGLAAAAQDRRRVRLRYRSWKGAETERDLDTYGLVFHSGRWYATGFDHRSGEVRTFRVDRVVDLRPGSESYEIPADVDPVQHVTRSLAAVPYAHEVEVLLDATLTAVRQRIPPSVGTLTQTDGKVLLHTRAENLDGMARMLAGLGWPFEIRRPEALRTAVRNLCAHLAAQAARGEPTPMTDRG